jgi:hypothetical protein
MTVRHDSDDEVEEISSEAMRSIKQKKPTYDHIPASQHDSDSEVEAILRESGLDKRQKMAGPASDVREGGDKNVDQLISTQDTVVRSGSALFFESLADVWSETSQAKKYRQRGHWPSQSKSHSLYFFIRRR